MKSLLLLGVAGVVALGILPFLPSGRFVLGVIPFFGNIDIGNITTASA